MAAKRAREMQLANNCVVENLFLINVGKALEEIDAEALSYVPSEDKVAE